MHDGGGWGSHTRNEVLAGAWEWPDSWLEDLSAGLKPSKIRTLPSFINSPHLPAHMMHYEGKSKSRKVLTRTVENFIIHSIINGALFFPAEILLIAQSLTVPGSLRLHYKTDKRGLSEQFCCGYVMTCQLCAWYLPNCWNSASSTAPRMPPITVPRLWSLGFSALPAKSCWAGQTDEWMRCNWGRALGHSEPEGEASPRFAVPSLRDSHRAKATAALVTAERSEARCEGRGLLEGAPCHWMTHLVPSIAQEKEHCPGGSSWTKRLQLCQWSIHVYWFSHVGVKM